MGVASADCCGWVLVALAPLHSPICDWYWYLALGVVHHRYQNLFFNPLVQLVVNPPPPFFKILPVYNQSLSHTSLRQVSAGCLNNYSAALQSQ